LSLASSFFFLIFAPLKKYLVMNFNLTQIPDRHQKPRTAGLTMVMDKGLSVNEAQNFLSV